MNWFIGLHTEMISKHAEYCLTYSYLYNQYLSQNMKVVNNYSGGFL